MRLVLTTCGLDPKFSPQSDYPQPFVQNTKQKEEEFQSADGTYQNSQVQYILIDISPIKSAKFQIRSVKYRQVNRSQVDEAD